MDSLVPDRRQQGIGFRPAKVSEPTNLGRLPVGNGRARTRGDGGCYGTNRTAGLGAVSTVSEKMSGRA